MRIIMVLVPHSISFSPAMIFLRACSLSSGATASATSRKIISAADWAAFSNNPGLEPGTASSERCRRGVACSMIVKLMPLILSLLLDSLGPLGHRAGSAGGAKAAGDAIDRQQQVRL